MLNIENEMHKNLRNFDMRTDHLISAKQSDQVISNKKIKGTCRMVDFTVPAHHKVKLNESEKSDNYQDLTRELKKLWNMNLTVILIEISVVGTVTKGLVQGQEDLEIWQDNIRRTALLKSPRIARIIWET